MVQRSSTYCHLDRWYSRLWTIFECQLGFPLSGFQKKNQRSEEGDVAHHLRAAFKFSSHLKIDLAPALVCPGPQLHVTRHRRRGPKPQWCTVPYRTILFHTVPYCATYIVPFCAILCNIVLYCVIFCHIVPDRAILCHGVTDCATLCHIVLYCAILCYIVP